MISSKMNDAINAQINAEFWSAYLYLSMGLNFEAKGHQGVANWFKIQFQEEQAHAQIFMNMVNSRGGRVVLKPIESVPTDWDTILAAFEDTLAHERKVTALINNLYAIAEEEHDYASRGSLDWFVKAHRPSETHRRQRSRSLHARPGACSTHLCSALAPCYKGISTRFKPNHGIDLPIDR